MQSTRPTWPLGALVLVFVFTIGTVQASPWTLESTGGMVRYIAQGSPAYGHTLGFVKLKEHCQQDILWLTWTTERLGFERGAHVPVLFTVGGNTTELSLPVTSVQELPTEAGQLVPTSVLLFTDVVPDAELVAGLANGQALTVTVDGKLDAFSLQGFGAARREAYTVCAGT